MKVKRAPYGSGVQTPDLYQLKCFLTKMFHLKLQCNIKILLLSILNRFLKSFNEFSKRFINVGRHFQTQRVEKSHRFGFLLKPICSL